MRRCMSMSLRSRAIWPASARVAASRAVVSSSALRTRIASGNTSTGMRATKVPDCGKISMSDSSASRSSASRTGVRLTPRACAISFSAVASLVTIGGLDTPAFGQQKLALKASDVHPAGYPTVEAIESIGKKLEKATNGRLSIQMFASMQLGGEKEAIEQAQVGAIQFARVSVGALGPVIDELNVFNLPFLFRNTAHMQKVIDGPIGQELLDKVTNNPRP